MPQNTFYLDSKWKIKDFSSSGIDDNELSDINPDNSWIDAEVPGDIHNDLFKAGKIKDPYYSDNSADCGWITEKDWYYYKTFRLPESFFKSKTFIAFEGIDTYSNVWLNGKKIGITDNMFREFSFDVTDLIRKNEENTLIVRIKSIKHMMKELPHQKYFACFNTARIFVRKAQCHFGWDWAPDLPAVGIWQGVKIIASDEGQIQDVFIQTRIDGRVSFFIRVDRKPAINQLANAKEEIRQEKIEDDLLVQVSSGNLVYEKKIDVRGGKNHLTIQVENPRLWWPNGYGQPELYHYSIKLLRRGAEIDKKEGKFGIREIELKQEPLKEGGFGFQFNINGTPVYCKGANWVPVDCFTGTARDEKYKNLVNLAREANFNMLRVWGGGIYERDIFYDLCDQNGIMVWQDFMFACSDVPDDHHWFVDMVIPEIEYQVKRLRNHPSVVYWCGGNEKTGSAGLKVSYGERLFRYIIRGICNDLDITRPYGAASPSSFSDLGNDMDSGDTHCNCLESSFKKGMTVFREEIEKIHAVFNSECAIQGPARYQSMSRFVPAEKLWPLNDLWEFRYKDNPYNTLVETYLDIQKNAAEKLFGRIDNVQEFLKKAMTAHAEILRAEIEHQRCRKWVNNGIMFWMYSDIWPTGTWSVVDYYELPKPAYYAVKRAYQPVLVSIQQIGGDTKVFISNDLLQELTGIVEFGQASIYGGTLWEKELNNITVKENESVEIADIGSRILEIPDSYLFARFRGNGQTAGATFFPDLWKDIDWQEPGLSYEVISETGVDGRFEKAIKISAKLYARMVSINLPGDMYARFSDNFFDLEAGEAKFVTIVTGANFNCNELRLSHWLTEWI
ncbi:MAG: sugar-binding domain-containing protein [Clostridiaceae bacterium]